MRLAWLLAPLLLLPAATAQVPASLTLDVAPFEEELPALGAPALRPFWVNVTCVAAAPADAPAVRVRIEEMPPWATALVEPSEFVVEAARCVEGAMSFEGVLNVSVTDQAPAHAPAPIRLAATAEGVGRNETVRRDVPVAAAYFSILDVQLAESIGVAPPGSMIVFPVKLTNFGNGNTRVRFLVEESSGGLVVQPVQELTLQSKQQGGIVTSIDVPIAIRTPKGAGYHNEVGVVNLRLQAEEADGTAKGDESTLSLLVTTKGVDTPGPGLLVLLGSLLVAVSARRLTR